jgi:anti-sigma B factor antagonist
MSLTLLPRSTRPAHAVGIGLTVRVVRAAASRTVVSLAGEADCSTTAELSDALSRVVASHGGDVVIDLSDLAFIDTANIRVLATAHHLLADQGRTLEVRSPSRLGRRVLELFGLVHVIEDTAVVS